MIGLTCRNTDGLFLLSFKTENNYPMRDSLDKYYMPLVEIKDFNTFIDNKPFFDQLVKNKQESYEEPCKETMITKQETY